MSISEVRGNNYDNFVKDGLVIVDFYSDRCIPCEMFSKVLEKIHYENPSLRIVKVNSSKYPYISIRNKIAGYPTVVFFKNGQEIERHLGFMDYNTIKGKIKRLLK